MLFPGGGREEYHHRDEFKSSYKHNERKQKLRKIRIIREITHRADSTESGTYIADAGEGCCEIGFKICPIDRYKQSRDSNHSGVDHYMV